MNQIFPSDENARPSTSNNMMKSNLLATTMNKPNVLRDRTNVPSTNVGLVKPGLQRKNSNTRITLGDISNQNKPDVNKLTAKIVKSRSSTMLDTNNVTQSIPITQNNMTINNMNNNLLRKPMITIPDNKLQTQTIPVQNSLSISNAFLSNTNAMSASTLSTFVANSEVNSLSKMQIKDDHDDAVDMSVTISPMKNSERPSDGHLWVSEYADDILQYFRSCETRYLADSNYMSKQPDVNAKMREILIDWLHEVHARFRLQSETLFLTVNIVDRFLERRAVSRKKLQLVGCVAMLIASKYEEIYVPEVNDFVTISDKAYTREQIVQMESIMLSTLEFNFTVPSPLRFVERFIKIANFNETQKMLTHYLLQMVLQNYHFLQYVPSMIASSAVWLVMYQDGMNWNSTMQNLTTYSISQMRECIIDLYTMYESLNGSKYRAVQRKFMKPKCLEVAKIVLKKPTL